MESIIPLLNFDDTYSENAALSKLDFEANELTIVGFHTRYQKWLDSKLSAFYDFISHLEEQTH